MALVTMPDASWVADTGEIPGLELVTWDLHAQHPRADEIAVVVPPYLDPHQRLELLGSLPRLELVQLLTAGFDNVTPQLPPGVTLCSGGGIHDASTAELALTLTLASLRGIPDFVRAQDRREWIPTRIWPALAARRGPPPRLRAGGARAPGPGAAPPEGGPPGGRPAPGAAPTPPA